MKKLGVWSALLLVGSGLVGCVDNQGLLNDNPEATWNYIQRKIFAGRGGCAVSGCHHPYINPEKGLALGEDQYGPIVEQAMLSSTVPTMKLVEPGDKSKSFLYLKVTGVLPVNGGEVMPPYPAEKLSDEDIELIGRWIDEGAVKAK